MDINVRNRIAIFKWLRYGVEHGKIEEMIGKTPGIGGAAWRP